MYEKLHLEAKSEFEALWQEGTVPLWERGESVETSLYCVACDKIFTKESVFEGHKTGKKHLKAVQALSGKKGILVNCWPTLFCK